MLCGVPSPAWPPARPLPPPPGGGARLGQPSLPAVGGGGGALIAGGCFGILPSAGDPLRGGGGRTAGLGVGGLVAGIPALSHSPELTESFPLSLCPCAPQAYGFQIDAVPSRGFNKLRGWAGISAPTVPLSIPVSKLHVSERPHYCLENPASQDCYSESWATLEGLPVTRGLTLLEPHLHPLRLEQTSPHPQPRADVGCTWRPCLCWPLLPVAAPSGLSFPL